MIQTHSEWTTWLYACLCFHTYLKKKKKKKASVQRLETRTVVAAPAALTGPARESPSSWKTGGKELKAVLKKHHSEIKGKPENGYT